MILSRVVDESGLILRLLDLATGVKHIEIRSGTQTHFYKKDQKYGASICLVREK